MIAVSLGSNMDAINSRLRQLEDSETRLYIEQQFRMQNRMREDENLLTKRKDEDEAYVRALEERDREEDDLRRNRRLIGRASIASPQQITTIGSVAFTDRRTTRSSSSAHRTATVAVAQPDPKKVGLPTAFDGQGKALYTRVSDGKLVYLKCYMPGCDRTSFPNVRALRQHIVGPRSRHKLGPVFSNNKDAIEACGEAAPGQVELSEASAPNANMTQSSMPIASQFFASVPKKEDETSYGSSSETLVDSDAGRSTSQSRALGISDHADLKATELFEGSSSSETNDSDEGQAHTFIPAHQIDQHTATNGNAIISQRTLTGGQLFAMCVKAEQGRLGDASQAAIDPIIKEEHDGMHYLLHDLSVGDESPQDRFDYPEKACDLMTTTKAKAWTEDSETRCTKRAMSSPSITPLAQRKRLRYSNAHYTS